MARRSRATGVGRGNGAGSAKTQYLSGMPSGNPNGRPRKVKQAPARSIVEALSRELTKIIGGEENGRPFKKPQLEAMVAHLFAEYPRATPPIKLRILDWCVDNLPELREEREHVPSPDAIKNIIERLQQEHQHDVEVAKQQAAWEPRR